MANGRRDDYPFGGTGNGAASDGEQGDPAVLMLSQCKGAHCAQVEDIGWPMSPEYSRELKARIDAVMVQAMCRFRGMFDCFDVAQSWSARGA
ncbi:hypothetical protein [Xanthomonas albilineans]|uniref:hypothetical protein n=1 Tax=Xanthomonas albilineans TaxID=29447 RepID=UPI0005F35A22|nr:hypothetical protein [Xanthomonas albilineans]PPU92925.1 hypothetical protein XalbCFBP2523_08785 [Xanthomonas albilineans]